MKLMALVTLGLSFVACDASEQTSWGSNTGDEQTHGVGQVFATYESALDQVVERKEPVMITDCLSGGREFSYSDNSPESHARSLTFQYNASVAAAQGLPTNPFTLEIDFSKVFDRDINGNVSSSDDSTALSASSCSATLCAVYRKTTAVHRIAKMFVQTETGPLELGQATLKDWVFESELAEGDECPPPSNLPM